METQRNFNLSSKGKQWQVFVSLWEVRLEEVGASHDYDYDHDYDGHDNSLCETRLEEVGGINII